MSVVCNEYNISTTDLTKPNHVNRPNEFTEPKYLAMYLVYENNFYTMTSIGPMFGFPTTIAAPINWVKLKINSDTEFNKRLFKIEVILRELYKTNK